MACSKGEERCVDSRAASGLLAAPHARSALGSRRRVRQPSAPEARPLAQGEPPGPDPGPAKSALLPTPPRQGKGRCACPPQAADSSSFDHSGAVAVWTRRGIQGSGGHGTRPAQGMQGPRPARDQRAPDARGHRSTRKVPLAPSRPRSRRKPPHARARGPHRSRGSRPLRGCPPGPREDAKAACGGAPVSAQSRRALGHPGPVVSAESASGDQFEFLAGSAQVDFRVRAAKGGLFGSDGGSVARQHA